MEGHLYFLGILEVIEELKTIQDEIFDYLSDVHLTVSNGTLFMYDFMTATQP